MRSSRSSKLIRPCFGPIKLKRCGLVIAINITRDNLAPYISMFLSSFKKRNWDRFVREEYTYNKRLYYSYTGSFYFSARAAAASQHQLKFNYDCVAWMWNLSPPIFVR